MARGSARDEDDGKPRRGNRAGGASGANGERVVLDRGVMKKAKDCCQCQRVFTWRKKWEKDWDNVQYCSDACKSAAAKLRK
mmetsp:Transcript_73842/g.158366  ORF Transcript_73842/g.158366 Transcript_73842/m.158366 type:complete len:81 (+) Transcript_73842:75-317(+)